MDLDAIITKQSDGEFIITATTNEKIIIIQVPIYYIMEGTKWLGIPSIWYKNTWTITTKYPNSINLFASSQPNARIVIQNVQGKSFTDQVSTLILQDPWSHVKTTYMLDSDVMAALSQTSVSTQSSGNIWVFGLQ